MITLRDVFAVYLSIVEVDITAREPETLIYIHEWEYGPNIDITAHMAYEISKDRLTVAMEKINAHGDTTRNGYPEIGWGVKTEIFPKALLDAPITSMHVSNYRTGDKLTVDVEMQRLTAMTLLEGNKP